MTDPSLPPDPPWWLAAPARRGWTALLLVLMVVIAWLAFSPRPPPQVDTGWDKSNHLLAFAVLAFTAELAFWPRPRRRWFTGLGLLAYGALIELVQSQIPQRSGEWPDLLADAVGILLGQWLVRWATRLAGQPTDR